MFRALGLAFEREKKGYKLTKFKKTAADKKAFEAEISLQEIVVKRLL